MVATESQTLAMTNLVDTLIEDIGRKGLRAGDRYLSDKEAAQMLSVSSVTANRAMRVLAKRRVIVRRQRAGTFVGPNAPRQAEVTHRLVYFFMPADLKAEWPLSDMMLEGLQKHIPDVQMQINTIPTHDSIGFLRQFVEQIASLPSTAGIVLTSTTRQVRQFFAQRNLPVVVCGHVESNINLPWVDRDQRAIGCLMAEHFLKKGHRRIALLMRDSWAPGDNLLVDGISEQLSTHNAVFTVRSAAVEPDLVRDEIRQMLLSTHKPTAIICRFSRHAQLVIDTALTLGIKVPDELAIGVATPMTSPMNLRNLSCYVSVDLLARSEAVGRMFARMMEGKKPGHYEMSVTLEVPKQSDDVEDLISA